MVKIYWFEQKIINLEFLKNSEKKLGNKKMIKI